MPKNHDERYFPKTLFNQLAKKDFIRYDDELDPKAALNQLYKEHQKCMRRSSMIEEYKRVLGEKEAANYNPEVDPRTLDEFKRDRMKFENKKRIQTADPAKIRKRNSDLNLFSPYGTQE